MLKLYSTSNTLSPVQRYSLALALLLVALVLRLTLLTQSNGLAFVTFYPAIIISFYYCGALPGALVAICSGVLGAYFFIAPYNQFSLNFHIPPSIVFFCITSSLIGILITRLQRHIHELNSILDNEMVGSMMLKNRRIVWCNKAISLLLGYTQTELKGATTKLLMADKQTFETVGQEAYPLFSLGKTYRTQFEMKKADGSRVWVDVSGAAMAYDKSLSLWLVNDISKLKSLEQELKHQVNHDFLTGLDSRAWFMSQAETELNRAIRFGSALSLLMLDIDFFKRVNDTYGHQTGDLVLRTVADLSRKILRDFDICGRLGGEEFAVLLPETDKDKAFEVAERLRLAIADAKIQLPSGAIPLRITISIGLSTIAAKEDNIDLLISKADKALYTAKNTGRNRVCTT